MHIVFVVTSVMCVSIYIYIYIYTYNMYIYIYIMIIIIIITITGRKDKLHFPRAAALAVASLLPAPRRLLCLLFMQ